MNRLKIGALTIIGLCSIIFNANQISSCCSGTTQKSDSEIWLEKYRMSNDTWAIRSRRFNFTCYSGRVLYPYGPECADEELSKELYRSRRLDLGFNLTFMGHRFDKAWINQHGFISFQESFYGAAISQDDWPNPKYPYIDDPIFVAPLYAQTDLVGDRTEDVITTKYGRVLFKVVNRVDLPQVYTEEEKFVYEMSMKILNEGQAEIREAVPIAESFIASHAIIATWKSLAFSGNSLTDVDLKPRNTFQAALLTDTYHTYAIFNYEEINWYASTSQGGNPETGTGGKAAKIGFNRGNGTLWYGVRPFSENAQLMQDLEQYTNVDRPGRFIFRIDEWVQPAGCLNMESGEEKILHIWPRYANMLGGQEVNVTGPCFHNIKYFFCKWGDGYDAPITVGEAPPIGNRITDIRGRCIQPLIYYIGRLNLSISLDDGKTYDWKAEYTLVDPIRFPAKVNLVNINDWHMQASPPRLIIAWDRNELSFAESDLVDIELWGYYEDDHGPHWDHLQTIGKGKLNKGSFGFDVAPNRATNQTKARIYKLGAIRISMYDTNLDLNMFPDFFPKHIWSALHPIGWWRNDEMKFYYDKKSYLLGSSRGKNWPEDQCRWWHQYRKNDRFWMDELEICPPTLLLAIGDIGVWAPDPSCNMYGSQYNQLNCLQHFDAVHCVITMRNTPSGAGNRCCYDISGNLMYTNDTWSGSTPDRYHSLGMPPYNVYGKVPGLSHYFHDIVPYYLCCRWSNLCETYLYLRETKDAKGYREPRPAVAYGDPHLMTFDGKDYTFNGKGEFTLLRSRKFNFRLQARFEQPPNATYCLLSSKGQINATRITAIAAGQEDSDIVEVRARLYPQQTRQIRCDVLVNGKMYYFNFTEEKVQIFKNVFILSPITDRFMSNITIMFNTSGVGVQVGCIHGLINVRVSAPYLMFKETSGLFGYWDNITANDFMSPDNSTSQLTLKPDLLYQRFGMAWRMRDESESLFTYSGSWNFDTFHDNKPIIREWQRFRPWFTSTEVPFPSNVSFTKEQMLSVCDGDEQCLYDAAAMGSLEIGEATRDAHRYYRLLHESMKAVNSCGIYLIQGGVRTLSKGNYLAGSVMRITCKRGYMLFGWPEFYCNWNASWLPTNGQWLAEFKDWPYCEHYHITAIRWTAILISSLWVSFIVIALIRKCFFRKRMDYIIDEKKEGETYFDFRSPKDEKEVEALGALDSNNYSKDGFEKSAVVRKGSENDDDVFESSYNQIETNLNKEQSLSSQILNAELKPVQSFEPPCIILTLPHPSMKSGSISAKTSNDHQVNLNTEFSTHNNELASNLTSVPITNFSNVNSTENKNNLSGNLFLNTFKTNKTPLQYIEAQENYNPQSSNPNINNNLQKPMQTFNYNYNQFNSNDDQQYKRMNVNDLKEDKKQFEFNGLSQKYDESSI